MSDPDLDSSDLNWVRENADGTSDVVTFRCGEGEGVSCDVCYSTIYQLPGTTFRPHYTCKTCYNTDESKCRDFMNNTAITTMKTAGSSKSVYIPAFGFDVCVLCFAGGHTTSDTNPIHTSQHKLERVSTLNDRLPMKEYVTKASVKMG